MPTPLLFVACEKAIIAQDHTVSVIGILEKLVTNVPINGMLSQHAAVPMHWNVVTIWSYEPSDAGKEFETTTQLIAEDGSVAMHIGPFRIAGTPEKPRFRHVGTVEQFPITDGNLVLRL